MAALSSASSTLVARIDACITILFAVDILSSRTRVSRRGAWSAPALNGTAFPTLPDDLRAAMLLIGSEPSGIDRSWLITQPYAMLQSGC